MNCIIIQEVYINHTVYVCRQHFLHGILSTTVQVPFCNVNTSGVTSSLWSQMNALMLGIQNSSISPIEIIKRGVKVWRSNDPTAWQITELILFFFLLSCAIFPDPVTIHNITRQSRTSEEMISLTIFFSGDQPVTIIWGKHEDNLLEGCQLTHNNQTLIVPYKVTGKFTVTVSNPISTEKRNYTIPAIIGKHINIFIYVVCVCMIHTDTPVWDVLSLLILQAAIVSSPGEWHCSPPFYLYMYLLVLLSAFMSYFENV